MRKFEKITVWTPDGKKDLDTLCCKIIGDNLKNSMELYYEIGYIETTTIETEVENEPIVTERFVQAHCGNVSIKDTKDKTEYSDLGTSNGIDINEEIFRRVALKLNLTLTK